MTFKTSLAQTILSGKIVDKMNEPIPFAHLHIKNTNQGTVSNEDGKFRLVSDNVEKHFTLIISSLGYKTIEVAFNEEHQIYTLYSETTQLKEVTLKPINYGMELIEKAIKAIPNNYPLAEEQHTGFLRETTRWKENETPIYIVEAVIESIKKPYSREHLSGDVKLNEFRKYESEQLDSLDVRIYGGGHDIHSFDIVARRSTFLGSPKNFTYTIKDTLRKRNKDIFKIYFQNERGQSGHVYILDSSFAILKVESYDTSFKTFLDIGQYKRKFRDIKITYEQGEGGLWRLKHCNYKTAFEKKEKELILTNDYVTTKVEVNPHGIPYLERFQYQDILLDAPKQYNPDFWNNYNIILPDDKVEQLFKSNLPSSNGINKSKTYLIEILKRVSTQMTISWDPISISPYSLHYENNTFLIQQNGSFSKHNSISIYNSLLYQARPNLFLGYAFKSNLTKSGITSHDFVISKNINLNPKGRPIKISPYLEFGYQQINFFLQNYNNEDFTVNGKTLNSNNTDVYLSQRNLHLQPNIALKIEKSRKLNFMFSYGYNFPFNASTGLLFHERKKFFLFSKRAFLKNNQENLDIDYENKRLLENKFNIAAGIVYRWN
ncbi:hypothetical protein Musp01_27270 [Muricauda sp. NBRC 101325]|nr:hypothetical protein Musp01_27270 [Muricauda sp. NBRC 101325]